MYRYEPATCGFCWSLVSIFSFELRIYAVYVLSGADMNIAAVVFARATQR
jgi:hypothetical protein